MIIHLDGKRYSTTDEGVTKVSLQDYPPQYRTSGRSNRSDLTGADQWPITFGGGFGPLNVPLSDPYNEKGVFWDSNNDTRWAKDDRVYPPIVISTPTVDTTLRPVGAGDLAVFLRYCNFGSNLYAIVQKYVADPPGADNYTLQCGKWTGSTTTWAASGQIHNPTTDADCSALGQFLAVQGGTFFAHVTETGGTYGYLYRSTDAVTWTDLQYDAGANPRIAGGASDQAGPLIAQATNLVYTYWDNSASSILVYKSTNATSAAAGAVTSTLVATIPSAGPLLGLELYADPDGVEVVWVRTREGYGYLNSALTAYVPVVTHGQDASTAYGIKAWQGSLYVPNGETLEQFQWSGGAKLIKNIGPNRGFSSAKTGHVAAMDATADWLWIAYGGQEASKNATILTWNGEKWDQFYKNSTANKRILDFIISSADDSVTRLHLANFSATASSAERYLDYVTDDPRMGSVTANADLDTINTPDFDAGFPELDGIAYKITAVVSAWNSGTITVQYGLDGASHATSLGNASSSSPSLTFGTNGVGVSFKKIGFQFSGTGTTNPYPIMFVLYFKKKFTTRYAYYFTIDLNNMPGGEFDARPETVLSTLETAKDSVTLIPFIEGQQSSVNVEIKDIKFGHTWGQKDNQFIAEPRQGYVAIQLETPV